MKNKKYIPALRFSILTPMFDFILTTFMKEKELKSRLVSGLNIQDNEKVLDFGCGTGTLAIMIKESVENCDMYAVDVDLEVLEIAERKAEEKKIDINFIKYDGEHLPYETEYFDKIVTSLVLHHLTSEEKYNALNELQRVLKNGGELHILDFGIQKTAYTKLITGVMKHIEPIEDNIRGNIPKYLNELGYVNIQEVGCVNTLLGSVSFYFSNKA